MLSSEGVLAFYRGLSPTLLAVFPYAGMQFFFYNVFKNLLATPPKSGNSGGEKVCTFTFQNKSPDHTVTFNVLPLRKPEKPGVWKCSWNDQQNNHLSLWPLQEETAGGRIRSSSSSLWTGKNRLVLKWFSLRLLLSHLQCILQCKNVARNSCKAISNLDFFHTHLCPQCNCSMHH